MPGKPFRSFNNLPIVGQAPSAAEMAADLCREMAEVIQAARLEATRRELACEPPLPTTAEHRGAYAALEALVKGRHRAVVLPILFEEFPELLTPATVTAEELAMLQKPEGEA